MDELLYVISLGFSGSDVGRAMLLVLIGALFVTRRFLPWKMTLVVLVIDQAWPYLSLLAETGNHALVAQSFRGQMMRWEDNLAPFLVRWAGLYILLRGSFSLRRKLQTAFPDDGKPGILPF